MEDLHEEMMGVRESLIDWVIITKKYAFMGKRGHLFEGSVSSRKCSI